MKNVSIGSYFSPTIIKFRSKSTASHDSRTNRQDLTRFLSKPWKRVRMPTIARITKKPAVMILVIEELVWPIYACSARILRVVVVTKSAQSPSQTTIPWIPSSRLIPQQVFILHFISSLFNKLLLIFKIKKWIKFFHIPYCHSN